MARLLAAGPRTLLAKSCLVCGKLKMADEYQVLEKKYRGSYCKDCRNRYNKPGRHSSQRRALRTADKHWEPWTQEDLDKLKAMMAQGLTGPEMAKKLNRSLYAIYSAKTRFKKEFR